MSIMNLRRLKLGAVGSAVASSHVVNNFDQAAVLVLTFIDQASIKQVESIKDGERRPEPTTPTSIKRALAAGRSIMCSNDNIAQVFEIRTL